MKNKKVSVEMAFDYYTGCGNWKPSQLAIVKIKEIKWKIMKIK